MDIDSGQRKTIPKEPAIQAGWLKINYKVVWLLFLIPVCVGVILVSALEHLIFVGLGFGLFVTVLYVLLIGIQPFEHMRTTILAKAYRKGSHKTLSLIGQTQYSSEQPRLGETFGTSPPGKKQPGPVLKILGRVDFYPYEVETVDAEGRPTKAQLGINRDHRYNTHSSTMWAAGSSLLSVDDNTQAQRQEAFAHLLDLIAEIGLIHRFVWRDQTLVGEHQDPEALLEKIRKAAGLSPRESPGLDNFVLHTKEMGAESIVHRTTFSFSVYDPTVKRLAKAVGGLEELLRQQLASFYSAAVGDGVSPIGLRAATFLSYNELVFENRLLLDPVFAKHLLDTWTGLEVPGVLLSEFNAWPQYADFDPDDYCKLGQTYHRGSYFEQFAGEGMLPKQFWDILKVPVTKTVTGVIQMVPPQHAQLRAEWTTTGARGSNIDRVASNRRVTAAQQVSAEAASTHEQEVAERKGQVGRMRFYVDVTGATVKEAAENDDKVAKAAALAPFTIEPLVGRQHLGIDAVMPIGRGLAALPVERWK